MTVLLTLRRGRVCVRFIKQELSPPKTHRRHVKCHCSKGFDDRRKMGHQFHVPRGCQAFFLQGGGGKGQRNQWQHASAGRAGREQASNLAALAPHHPFQTPSNTWTEPPDFAQKNTCPWPSIKLESWGIAAEAFTALRCLGCPECFCKQKRLPAYFL